MSEKKYVCVDLDGTIAHYGKWVDETHFGEPISGVQDAFKSLQSKGWKIIIFTTRGNKRLIEEYLNKNSIQFDHINENPNQPENAMGGKPIADVYVDDRGIQFNGNWQATIDEVLKFVPWEKRMGDKIEDEYTKEAAAFLGRDYEQIFNQLRYYDTQMWDIFKFSFGQLIASVAGAWTVFSLANGTEAPDTLTEYWSLVGAAILMISFVFSLLAVQLILRNRIYFSSAARYINDQRGFFLSSKPMGFSNRSKYYSDYRLPKPFDFDSTQYVWVVALSLLGTLMLGSSVGLLARHYAWNINAFYLGALIWLISGVGFIAMTVSYLRKRKETESD